MEQYKGTGQTRTLGRPVHILGRGSVAGAKEGRGPLGACFDYVDGDDRMGQDSWERAESRMQALALDRAVERAGREPELLFAGDLLNQCVASGYAARGRGTPFLGLYGACSTLGEGLCLGAMAVDGGFARCVAAVSSSHFCTAERQYRNPLEYGGQRTPTAQWTVTGSGAVVLGREGTGPRITHCTPGRVVDLGITDANNMGAAMAPAAADTILAHLRDTGRGPEDYDRIFTGDLGRLGGRLLGELLGREGVRLGERYGDCGGLIFDGAEQDVHCGGSGCGCCALVLTGYVLPRLESGRWRRVLFCPTGALHSPTALQQGESIPGICHALVLEGGE